MTAPPAERVNILVVDDRHSKLVAMEALLSELDENVVCVPTGADALRQLLEREFAVVLLDVNMPEMDGFETAALIRQRPRLRHVPIIFMTAGSDETRALHGYSLGAVDYILTPVVPEVLRTKVKVFVDLFRMAAELRRSTDERVALAAERAARAAAEAARRRAAFLADAGKLMARSLDLESTIAALLELVVPELADAAVVRLHVAGEDNVTVSPRGHPLTKSPELTEAMDEVARSLRTKTLEGGAEGTARGLACPVLTRGATGGVLGLALERGRPSLDAATVMLVEDLCGRAALAIENCFLYREIQDRDVRKDQFVAMLAHELRNPLSVISSALGVLESLGRSEETAQMARRSVRRQLQSLTRLIDDLVDVARITTGKITMIRAPVNLKDSAQRSIDALASEGRSEHLIELTGHDTWIHGDSVRIDQILTNLVGNARKYTPARGSIRIRVEPEGDDGVFEIDDSGVGMAPDVLAHAFDLFFQGDRPADRADGGLGIGLTLVRQLVELHGGSIEARSAGEGRGSRFTIRLPGCAAPGGDDPGSTAGKAAARPRRIVIVEDNEDARQMLKALLELARHEVHDAADGPAAIELVGAVEPEVAFVDIGLPGMDGYEVARRLRERHKELCLVALSGYGQPEDRRKAVEAGFDLHLLKPVDPERLAAIIAELPARRVGQAANGWVGGGLA